MTLLRPRRDEPTATQATDTPTPTTQRRGPGMALAAGLVAYSKAPQVLQGMFLLLLSALGFAAMHAVIRHLSQEMHAFEVVFFRNLFGLLALLPWLWRDWRGGRRIFATDHLSLHSLRAVLQIAAMLLFFTALSRVPLAEVSALSFTAPLFATAGAVVFLREPIHARRIAALLLGFGGAMVVVRPGFAALDSGALLVFGSSAIWAFTLLLIKFLAKSDSSLTLTAYMGIHLVPLSLVPALFVWRWPAPREYLLLAFMGVLGTAGHLLMAQAFKRADATAILPVDYTRLVWASLLGFFLFGEVPAVWTWIGGSTIFASTTYIAYREARANARDGTIPPTTGPPTA